MSTQMTYEDFMDHIDKTLSENTVAQYRVGIKAFSEWYGKIPNEILEERKQDWASTDLHQKKRFVREIEKFHSWLLQPIHYLDGKDKPPRAYAVNSARTMCLGIMQLFAFYEMPVTIPRGSDISKTVASTKDFVPTAEQYRAMYRVSDDLRGKLIVSQGKDLAWRMGDFVNIKKDMLPNLDADPPLAFDLITEKEDVLAKSFLSAETVELLKQWLPTLPKDNPYLFPSNGANHIDEDTVNRILRELAAKAEIKIPKNKRLRFHAFRKRFLTECANLSIDVNIAKILCGKDVESSMLAYLSEVEHRKAFLKVQDVLNLTGLEMRKTAKPATELEKEVEDLKRLIHGIIAVGGRDLVEQAKEVTKLENLTMKSETVKDAEETGDATEIIREIGEAKRRKQLEEYQKLIESNNNNNH